MHDQADLIPFPPLPPLPLPPRFPPDPRQRIRNRIINELPEMQLATDTGMTGYPASGVNLGQIKDALEDALKRFSMAVVQTRWDSDVRSFVFSVLRIWVQRPKHMKADLCDNGVAIMIETQDDHGYYHYHFDVFPGQRL